MILVECDSSYSESQGLGEMYIIYNLVTYMLDRQWEPQSNL